MSVALVDYGVGNILSVARALQTVTTDLVVTVDRDVIAKADHVIVPGVGSFSACMDRVHDCKLTDLLRELSEANRPMLGICVGMQMLFDRSSEFGDHEGLGLVAGTVERIVEESLDGERIKIPHIGWSPLDRPEGLAQWEGTVLDEATPGAHFYFLHSYAAHPLRDENLLATTNYHGQRVTSVVGIRRTYGMQFHPEKSGPGGLALLRRFVSL